MSFKKLLSIDGGGIKGVFAAQFLADIEETYNVRLYEFFDIITGTSTGGIIASALALGIPAKDILELYLKRGKEIFSGYSSNRLVNKYKSLRRFFKAKYTNDDLKRILCEVFGDKKVGDCKTRLLIPAFNLETYKIEVFKTAHDERYIRDYKESIVNVLMSTTAAPTYFPDYKFTNRGRYIDGGIGSNNPSHLAVTESIVTCGWDRKDLKLLSIGCTEEFNSLSGKKGLDINLQITNLFMRAESLYSENMSRLFTGDSNFLRINPVLKKGIVGLDNVSPKAFDTLIILAKDESKQHLTSIHKKFLDAKKEEFTPVYRMLA